MSDAGFLSWCTKLFYIFMCEACVVTGAPRIIKKKAFKFAKAKSVTILEGLTSSISPGCASTPILFLLPACHSGAHRAEST